MDNLDKLVKEAIASHKAETTKKASDDQAMQVFAKAAAQGYWEYLNEKVAEMDLSEEGALDAQEAAMAGPAAEEEITDEEQELEPLTAPAQGAFNPNLPGVASAMEVQASAFKRHFAAELQKLAEDAMDVEDGLSPDGTDALNAMRAEFANLAALGETESDTPEGAEEASVSGPAV